MFSNEFAKYVDALTVVVDDAVTGGEAIDAQARAGVMHVLDVVVPTLAPSVGSTVYATKDEVIAGAGGGIPEAVADERYAPKTGSLVYATKAEIPDVSNYADKDYVDTQLATKQAVGTYLTDGSVYQTKANMTGDGTTYYSSAQCDTNFFLKSNVNTSTAGSTSNNVWSALLSLNQLSNKTDVGTAYTKEESDAKYLTTDDASAYQTKANMVVVGAETTYYSQAKVDALLAAVGGGIPEATADERYAPKTGSLVYATKAEIPDVSTKADTIDVTTALALKSDTSHLHTDVYAPVTNPANGSNNYAGKDIVDGLLLQNAYLFNLVNMVYTGQSLSRKVWLRARDLVGSYTDGQEVSIWSPPAGSNINLYAEGTIGSGTVKPQFFDATSTNAFPYVACTATLGSGHFNIWDGVTLTGTIPMKTKGVTMFMVFRNTAVNQNMYHFWTKFSGTNNDNMGFRGQGTSQTWATLSPETPPAIVTPCYIGGANNSGTVNVWSAIAMRLSVRTNTLTGIQWYTASNPRSLTSLVACTPLTDKTYTNFQIGPPAGGGFHVAEVQYYDQEMTDNQMYSLWNQLKQQYGLQS